MKSFSEFRYLALDFVRYSIGRDYFRQSQPLGCYFRDERCYYNDLRGKAIWTGPCADEIPILYIPSLGQEVVFPIMVLLYGLGSLDRYFIQGEQKDLTKVRRVVKWILAALGPSGCFDNRFSQFDPDFEFWSDNSCMAQGLALSFVLRVIEYGLLDVPLQQNLSSLVDMLVNSMLAPVESGGTALETVDELYLLEHCRKDQNVVLNGWIYGTLGLWDVQRFRPVPHVAQSLERTFGTLKRTLPQFYLRDGWTYYDSQGRRNSPFYHRLHCRLLEALYRLTNDSVFLEYFKFGLAADVPWLRMKYMGQKILQRLSDHHAHTTVSGVSTVRGK